MEVLALVAFNVTGSCARSGGIMTGRSATTGMLLSAAAEPEPMVPIQFEPKSSWATVPVGYHGLHPDVSMNFQMNRWYSWVGEPEMLEEMRVAAPRIAAYADWKREFVALAESAQKRGHILRAGFYWRSAEFFMRPNDPERKNVRQKFLEAIRSVYALELGERHAVPYADGNIEGLLPAYRLTPARSKDTIVFFGGFDSYIEELTQAFIYLRDAGYDVIALEAAVSDNRIGCPEQRMGIGKQCLAALDVSWAIHQRHRGLPQGLRAAEPTVRCLPAEDVAD